MPLIDVERQSLVVPLKFGELLAASAMLFVGQDLHDARIRVIQKLVVAVVPSSSTTLLSPPE